MTPNNSIDAVQCTDNSHGDQSGVPVDERTIVLWVPDFLSMLPAVTTRFRMGHWHWWTSMACMCVTARRGM